MQCIDGERLSKRRWRARTAHSRRDRAHPLFPDDRRNRHRNCGGAFVDGYDYDRAVHSRVGGEQDIVVGVFPKDGLLKVVFRPNPSVVCGTVLR